jgi:glycosyltransferase involved in cell wall biosynthesis
MTLISIIVPTFNAQETLARCLDSAIAQTLPEKEIIVVDGGSTDGTLEIIRQFSTHLADWSSERDGGIYDAANKGLRRAQGEWIYFLGADDLFFDDTVLDQMAPILRGSNPNVRVVYGRVAMLGRNDEVLAVLGAPWPESRKRLDSYMSLPHQGIFHHRSLFQEHGEFDPTYRTGGDYEFLLRELLHREALFAGGVTVATCRTGGRSSRASDHIRLLREWRRAQKQHGVRMPPLRWLVAFGGACLQRLLYFLLGQKAGAGLFDFVRGLVGKPPYWSRIQ